MPSLKRSANPLDQIFQNLRDGNAALTNNCESEIEAPFLAPDSAHAQAWREAAETLTQITAVCGQEWCDSSSAQI